MTPKDAKTQALPVIRFQLPREDAIHGLSQIASGAVGVHCDQTHLSSGVQGVCSAGQPQHARNRIHAEPLLNDGAQATQRQAQQ